MLYIIIPLTLVVVGTLVWAWWEDRVGRDPVSSIDSFHRALSAMEPRRADSSPQPLRSQREDGDARDRQPPSDNGDGASASPSPDRREAAAR